MRLITLKTKQMIQTMGELRLTVYKDLRGMLGERALFKILVGRSAEQQRTFWVTGWINTLESETAYCQGDARGYTVSITVINLKEVAR